MVILCLSSRDLISFMCVVCLSVEKSDTGKQMCYNEPNLMLEMYAHTQRYCEGVYCVVVLFKRHFQICCFVQEKNFLSLPHPTSPR